MLKEKHICVFCEEKEVDEPGTICKSCCDKMTDRIDSADHQNRCEW